MNETTKPHKNDVLYPIARADFLDLLILFSNDVFPEESKKITIAKALNVVDKFTEKRFPNYPD